MPGRRNPPLTARQQQARAVQAEYDMAALFLIRRAAEIEASAAKAMAAGSPGNETARHARVAAYRNAAVRLVLHKRPASLGVPGWLEEKAS